MDEQQLILVKKEIDLQVSKIERILDKRGFSGNHFDDFLTEEKAKLAGMLKIYWLLGGEGYTQFKFI